MSQEQLEKRMEFIVEQQAQFTSDMQQLREAQAQTEVTVMQTGEIVARLAHATLEGFKDVNAKIDALVDSQIRTDEKFNRTDEKFNRTDERFNRTDEKFNRTDEKFKLLAESQAQTDETFKQLAASHMHTEADLRNLTALLDRHISEGKNGN